MPRLRTAEGVSDRGVRTKNLFRLLGDGLDGYARDMPGQMRALLARAEPPLVRPGRVRAWRIGRAGDESTAATRGHLEALQQGSEAR
ncbi:hypothetical protein [uncultured Propionibacterium sp.]|uniref:hypothetical protein n=1 Tax=uncultured Propionibacterium sp. TaxID=218066 RepID=UPI00292FE03B|nr:hypothetical protein [uncultured Propionibacterium sp.]